MSPLEPPFSTLPPKGPAPELDRSPGQKRATTRFWIAVAAGVCIVGFPIFFYLLSRAEVNANRGRPSIQNNLRLWGLAFHLYANESARSRWPGLSKNTSIWAPDLSVIYPEFFTDPSVLVAPEHPNADEILVCLKDLLDRPNPDFDTAAGLMALSFAYLGYDVMNEAEAKALFNTRRNGGLRRTMRSDCAPDNDHEAIPLNKEIVRGPITDLKEYERRQRGPHALKPVMVETWQWRLRSSAGKFSGAHVLFLDGHVAWVPLGTFPVVPSVMDGLTGVTP